jgi:hypothetical protein
MTTNFQNMTKQDNSRILQVGDSTDCFLGAVITSSGLLVET